MEELSYSLAPASWPICFQSDCPLANTCLRHAVGQLAPADLAQHRVVLPGARKDGNCRFFASAEPVVIARGMSKLMPHASYETQMTIRHSLYSIFGSRSQYYRYRNGELDITPEQQRLVAQLFRDCGISEAPRYDQTRTTYYFPKR